MKSDSANASTLAVRAFRARMREQGLVKKDVWIRPEHATELAAIEKALRNDAAPASTTEANRDVAGWTISSIQAALAQSSVVRDGRIHVEVIEGAEPTLHLVMHEHGELSVFIAVGGEQIIVESFLWPLSAVANPADFNAHVLRTHKLLPLSTIALETIGGVPGYTMFGSLDTHSSLASLMFEIETLAENVILASEAYAPFLQAVKTAGARA